MITSQYKDNPKMMESIIGISIYNKALQIQIDMNIAEMQREIDESRGMKKRILSDNLKELKTKQNG